MKYTVLLALISVSSVSAESGECAGSDKGNKFCEAKGLSTNGYSMCCGTKDVTLSNGGKITQTDVCIDYQAGTTKMSGSTTVYKCTVAQETANIKMPCKVKADCKGSKDICCGSITKKGPEDDYTLKNQCLTTKEETSSGGILTTPKCYEEEAKKVESTTTPDNASFMKMSAVTTLVAAMSFA